MFRITDTLGGTPVTFNYCQTVGDGKEAMEFLRSGTAWGMDTESTGLNPYQEGWKLRTFQFGNDDTSYVIPAHAKQCIEELWQVPVKWIAHNGVHDVRCIDAWLGYETGVRCKGETYFPAHYVDSRKADEGGVGHSLKDQAIAYIAHDAGKWEVELKKEFKKLRVPLPGQVYKSGKNKGQPRSRPAHIAEGWALIDPTSRAYIAYAAADPILTFRLWQYYRNDTERFNALYRRDMRLQQIADKLYRRAIKLDVPYTKRLSLAYEKKAQELQEIAESYGCENINSGQQIAATLLALGATLVRKTPKGQFKTDNNILRELQSANPGSEIADFIGAVLGAKQLLKRRESYTEAFLRNMDTRGRVSPSINILGARTARMSVSNPPLQQLPTKDRENDMEDFG
ncbi:MAG TPA: DNA polymerase [Candidatus Eisenbacteria bacterium]|nr:DNA polymerase [Candidatus Eisenbacteria bacterium]